MIVLYLLAGVVTGVAGMLGIRYYRKTTETPGPEIFERERIDITPEDIIGLLGVDATQDINSLIIEYKIHVKFPEFYEKYQILVKHVRELYVNELIDIFSKTKREYVRDLFDQYSGFNNQDVLLLLMREMQLDNKSMARILGLSLDTLKKRKTRLKQKMLQGKG